MLNAKSFPLINVQVPYEGAIDGTDLFIPFEQIEGQLDSLPADKNARIVFYCRRGYMSAIAARALVKHGYTNVWNLDGGMIGWIGGGKSRGPEAAVGRARTRQGHGDGIVFEARRRGDWEDGWRPR
jgi:rhodanese-related sulfurtransferase